MRLPRQNRIFPRLFIRPDSRPPSDLRPLRVEVPRSIWLKFLRQVVIISVSEYAFNDSTSTLKSIACRVVCLNK